MERVIPAVSSVLREIPQSSRIHVKERNGIQYCAFNDRDDHGNCLQFAEDWAWKTSLPKGAYAFDIGACVGSCSRWLASVCDCVIAFEPDDSMFNILLANVRLNNLYNVIPINCAVDSTTGVKCFRSFPSGSQISLGGDRFVFALSLDSLIDTYRVDYIKIDVEALEMNVLHGGKAFFERHRPVMLIEDHCNMKNDYTSNDILEWARENLYECELSYENSHVKQWTLSTQ